MGFDVIVAIIIYSVLGIGFMLFTFAWGIYQTIKSLFQLVRVKKDNNHDHANWICNFRR